MVADSLLHFVLHLVFLPFFFFFNFLGFLKGESGSSAGAGLTSCVKVQSKEKVGKSKKAEM